MARDRGPSLGTILWVLAGIYIVAGMVLLIAGSRHWPLVDAPVISGIKVGVVIAVVVGLGHAVWDQRNSRFDGVKERIGSFAASMLVGLLAGVMTVIPGGGWFAATNSWLDDSAPQAHRVTVLRQWHQSKGGNHIEVESWLESGDTIELHSPDDVYDAKPELVVVTTRAGAFGSEWVVDIDVYERGPAR